MPTLRLSLFLILAGLGLSACTGGQVTQAVAGGFKGWCKNADNCTVNEDRR